MEEYLKDIPADVSEKGISKVLLVRHEVIHIKHILTEIYHRESVKIEPILDMLGMTHFQYVKDMTIKLRRVHKLSRNFKVDPNVVVNYDYSSFFKYIDLTKNFSSVIVLDYDGVITSNSFAPLYKLCLDRSKTIICSANPNAGEQFTRLELPFPNKIKANRGKIKKLRTLLDISRKHDYTFYVDDEEAYLKIAWLFGIKTFLYSHGKIKHYSLNTK